MINQNLFLKPEEQKFLSMAVVSMFEQIQETAKNPNAAWTPESRKNFKEMLAAGQSLKIKLDKLGFDMRDLPPFEDKDWDEFFTKPS